jgi:hypothetical protein
MDRELWPILFGGVYLVILSVALTSSYFLFCRKESQQKKKDE